MEVLKRIKKIVLIVFTAAFVVVAAAIISTFLFKEKLVKHLIREANNYIHTPVIVNKVDLNFWEKFPQFAFSFTDVTIQESREGSTAPLLIAEKIFIMIDPLKLLQGSYVIEQIHIESGKIFVKIDPTGKGNYQVFQNQEPGSERDSLTLNLKRISFKQMEVHFQDARNGQEHSYYVHEQRSSLKVEDKIYHITASGDIESNFIRLQGRDFLRDRRAQLKAQLHFDETTGLLKILPSSLQIQNSNYELSGSVETRGDRSLILDVRGIETDIQSLLSLLPLSISSRYSKYRSKGEVYFSMFFSGSLDKGVSAEAQFGLNNATIVHPESQTEIRVLNLEGIFKTPKFSNPAKASLELKNVNGTIGVNNFKGALSINNLIDPELKVSWKGIMDISDLINMAGLKKQMEGEGKISGSFTFVGKAKDMKSRYTIENVTISGKLSTDGIQVNLLERYPLTLALSGDLTFDDDRVAATNAAVSVGRSSFLADVTIKNYLPYFTTENEPLVIDASLKGGKVDLEEMLLLGVSEQERMEHTDFLISPRMQIAISCNLDILNFKRFAARKLSGKIKVKDQKAVVENLRFNSMGGALSFDGIINTTGSKIEITNSAHLQGLEIDSVFYVFKNFNQNWLVDKNLKGRIDADVLTDFDFSPSLKFYQDSLLADINISIHNGQLNDFKPLMALAKYVDDEHLSRLKFSDLENDIHIENSIIYIPEMEVNSNVSNIRIQGSHTFDQNIDYRVVVPLRSFQKNHSEDMFGAVDHTKGGSKLHLKIVGNTEEYEIQFDTQAVSRKIVSDLKEEFKELKDAFKKKQTKEKEVLLSDDEFFEWDVEEDTTGIKRNQ